MCIVCVAVGTELSVLLEEGRKQAEESARRERERKEEEERAAHVRPWDRGKGGCGQMRMGVVKLGSSN